MFSGSLGRFTQMHSSKPASQQKLCINSCMTCMETLDLGGPAACEVHCLLAGLLITRVCDAAFQSLTCVRHREVLWTKWVMISYQNFSCLHIVVVNCVNDGPFVIDHHSLPGAWTLDSRYSQVLLVEPQFFRTNSCLQVQIYRPSAKIPRPCETQWHVAAGCRKNLQESIICNRNINQIHHHTKELWQGHGNSIPETHLLTAVKTFFSKSWLRAWQLEGVCLHGCLKQFVFSGKALKQRSCQVSTAPWWDNPSAAVKLLMNASTSGPTFQVLWEKNMSTSYQQSSKIPHDDDHCKLEIQVATNEA